jgi:hypothetical protein
VLIRHITPGIHANASKSYRSARSRAIADSSIGVLLATGRNLARDNRVSLAIDDDTPQVMEITGCPWRREPKS